MARLIIGHVTHSTARIWVRGYDSHPVAFVTVTREETGETTAYPPFTLEARHGYTGVIEVTGLTARKRYRCEVAFGEHDATPPEDYRRASYTQGRFVTFLPEGDSEPFGFLLGSCNLHTLSDGQVNFKHISQVAQAEGADFMIHCGDQIYADVPSFPWVPNFDGYRGRYRDAWSDNKPTRKFLTELPHYMILDDHEIVNNFANDMFFPYGNAAPFITLNELKVFSLKVYREFQHIHNPQTYGNQALYYHFSHGACRFFVMDVRTERYQRAPSRQIIGAQQMVAFKEWLLHYRDDVKFVVSSVPFVAEVRGDRNDKWCGNRYIAQREEILHHLLTHNITGVTFLVGDMHNSHHAEMQVTDGTTTIMVHELMSSPINQILKSSLSAYRTQTFKQIEQPAFQYSTGIDTATFYGEHSNCMLIKVNQRHIDFEIFRTRKLRRNEQSGGFLV